MSVYLVHHPLHNFSPEVGDGRLHGNGRLQGTLQYMHVLYHYNCICSEQLSMFHMEKRSGNTVIIVIFAMPW